jgi:hypothetical protein
VIETLREAGGVLAGVGDEDGRRFGHGRSGALFQGR